MQQRILASVFVVTAAGCSGDPGPQSGGPAAPSSPAAPFAGCGQPTLLADLEQYRLPYSLRALAAGREQTIVAWKETDILLAGQRPYAIRTRSFTPSAGWGAGQGVTGLELPQFAEPFAVSAANGELAALWTRWDGATFSVLGSQLPAGASWRPPEVLHEAMVYVDSLDIAHDEEGRAVAIWSESTEPPGRADLWTSALEAPGAWLAARRLGRLADRANRPQLLLGPGGGLLVWIELGYERQPQREIWARRYSAGAWSSPERIQTDRSSEVFLFGELAAARAPNGDAVVVWPALSGEDLTIRSARLRNDRWEAETTIGSGFLGFSLTPRTVAGYMGPSVAVGANGDAMAVWSARPNASTWRGIWASRLTAGGGWSPMERIDAGNNWNATYPAVAVDSSGRAVVAWLESTEPDSIPRTGAGVHPHAVWMDRYVPGRGWDGPRTLFAAGGDALTVAVAVDALGNASIVWAERPEVTRAQIWTCPVAPGS